MKYSKSKTKEIIFPIGGIGTGSIGLCGNGRFQDWEIYNHPNKGSFNGRSHLAVKATTNGKTIARVLNGDLESGLMGTYQQKYYTGYGYGPVVGTMAGFPHFRSHEFIGEFPFAKINLKDPEFPCPVTLEAFNPFTPGCSKDSSLPCGFYTVSFYNPTDETVDVTAALSVTNPYDKTENHYQQIRGKESVTLYSAEEKNTPKEGNLTIVSDGPVTGAEEYWYRGGWMDGIATFWRQFSSSEDLPTRHYEGISTADTATVWAKATLQPKERTSLKFLITWYNPICENNWDEKAKDKEGRNLQWRNYYATIFKSSIDVANYCLRHARSLQQRSKNFVKAFQNATLPKEFLEAATATLSVLKSPTCLRLEDGTFWGWEGVHEKAGSCEGTCTHVWNYAYAMCFLFPDLERSIREADYTYNLRDSGLMRFRLPLPPTKERGWEMACVDGQMGGIIKMYREWKISGDTDWLKKWWPDIKKSLDFATSKENPFRWDANQDGVLEGRQHHTLDQELFGPSSWLEGFYLAALKAGTEMAVALKDSGAAKRWEKLYQNGRDFLEKELFNGRYYIQKVDLSDQATISSFGEEVEKFYWNQEAKEMKYQIGEGSEIDQMCGQWHAAICGLGDIFDPKHRKIALKHMMAHNYKPTMRNFCNTWRNYIVNDEAGTVICDYEDTVYKPVLPIPYTEECMHGFEYQFAGLLLSEGMVDESIKVVKGVRNRYDGLKRNPFNEMECGSNYARSMAAFALIPLYAGFSFDYTKHAIGFNPVVKTTDFRVPFGVGGAFATFSQTENETAILILEGELTLSTLTLPSKKKIQEVLVDKQKVPFHQEGNQIQFNNIQIKKRLVMH